MGIKTNYISTTWWLLQAIILMTSFPAGLEFLVIGLSLFTVTLISVMTNSFMIKFMSYLLLLVYSIISFIVMWLLWMFFVYDLFDAGNFFFLIPLLNLVISIRNFQILFKSKKSY